MFKITYSNPRGKYFQYFIFAHFPEPLNCYVVDLVHWEHIEQQIRCHKYILMINLLMVKRKCAI